MQSSPKTRSLLLVEDSPEDRAMIHRYLHNKHQYTITHETSTGKEALARCQNEHFDCVLLDYHLPDMTGAAMLDALRKESAHAFLPVVVLTGRGSETTAVHIMKHGAQDYVLKEHISPDFLCYTIESAIETMAMQRQLEEQRQQLAKQQHAYQTLVENAQDMIERVDPQFRHLYVNVALAKEAGVSVEAFLGKTGREMGMPEDLCALWEHHLVAVFTTHHPRQFTFPFPSAEGERVYQAHLVPEFDEAGTVLSVLAISRDITALKETEKALLEREQRYHLALSGANMGTWDWDISTNRILWSEDLEVAMGFVPGSFGRTYEAFVSLVYPDDRAFVEQQIRQALHKKSDYQAEFRMYRTDGSIRWTATRAKALYDEDGRPTRMIGVDMDITEQKRVQQQALERTNELEGILEAMTDGLFILKQGRSTRLNQAARDLLGVPSGPLGEKQAVPPFLLLDEHGQSLPQAQWPEERLHQGEQLVGSNAAEVRLRRYDGREIEVSITGAPLRSAEGEITGVVMVSRDVTARRTLERRTHEALSALLMMAEQLVAFELVPPLTEEMPRSMQHLADLICRVLDCEATMLFTLEQGTKKIEHLAISGLEAEREQKIRSSLQGKSFFDYVPERQVMLQLEAGKAVVLDGARSSSHVLPLFAHQQHIALVPLYVRNALVGVISTSPSNPRHDSSEEEIVFAEAVGKLAGLVIEREHLLSEREEANATALAARKTSRQMDEFIGIISHELKTPLTSIKGNIQLAKRQVRRIKEGAEEHPSLLLTTTLQETLDRTERQVAFQNRLINDLLDASRIHADKLELHNELCDLVVIVQEIVEDQRRLLPTRAIRFSHTGVQALVQADAGRIGQVVNNYLSNALKYSEARCPIEITVEREGAFARVAVRDEGPGLAPADQKHLWERFYRVPEIQVKSGSGVGLGLGLHICKTLIERQGGRVGVQSIVGQGSTFWFTLPLAKGSDVPRRKEE